MSILTKPLFGTKPRGGATRGSVVDNPEPSSPDAMPASPVQAPAKGRPGSAAPLFLTSPRADLLPPEIIDNQKKRRVRRGLRYVVIAALGVSIAATAAAFAWSFTTGLAAAAAQQEAQSLAVERANYAELQATQQDIALTEAAQRVGVSTEIDWSAYFAELQSALPADVTLTDITVESAGVEDPYVQSDIPLELERIATLSFTATTSALPQIPDWIDRLSSMPGFADATPDSVQLTDGEYTAAVTMHINTDAYALRFLADETEAGE